MSDLTLPIIALTTLAGYFFSKDGKNTREVGSVRNRVEAFEKPNGSDIYNSKKTDEVNREMLERSFKNYKAAENPAITGVLPPLYNTYSVVGSDSLMAPEINSNLVGLNTADSATVYKINRLDDVAGSNKEIPLDQRPMFKPIDKVSPAERPDAYTDVNIMNINETISLLTGKPLDVSHNNMVPFFGSNVKQNVEKFINEPLLDRHTGNRSTFKHKQEVGKLFSNRPQDIYGTPLFTNQIETERYNPSLYRNNEKPFLEERISAPISGTYQNNIRPEFKSVDDLRVANKQKTTYAGRTKAGQITSVRGVTGKFEKYRPDTYYEQDHDKLLVTTGEVIAPIADQDYKTNFKPTSRRDYNLEYYGVSKGDHLRQTQRYKMGTGENFEEFENETEFNDSIVQQPKRANFSIDYTRNVTGNNAVNDYGKSSMRSYETERATTGVITHDLNVNKRDIGGKVRWSDDPKTTIKQTTLISDHSGHIKTTFDRGMKSAYDSGIAGMEAKTTHKETTIMNNYKGTVKRDGGMGYVVNKYDAKTTGKEIISENSEYTGSAARDSGMGYAVNKYDAKTTGKEIISENSEYTGSAASKDKNATIYSTYANPEKVRYAIHTENYQGNANRNVSSVSRNNYANAQIRDVKETLVSGERPSGPQVYQIASGKDSVGRLESRETTLFKEQEDKRPKLNVTLPQEIQTTNIIGTFTRKPIDNGKRESAYSDRLEPELVVKQHAQNPFSLFGK